MRIQVLKFGHRHSSHRSKRSHTNRNTAKSFQKQMRQILEKLDAMIMASTKKEEGSLDLNLLKMLKTNLVKNQKEEKPESEQAILRKMMKANQKAADEYRKAGREDLAEKELQELSTLKTSFCEPEVTETQIKTVVDKCLQKGMKMGDIMICIKKELPDANMGQAFQIVKNTKI